MNSRTHPLEGRELAAWMLARAKDAGAEACRVRVHRRRFVSVRYRDRRPDLVSEASTRGLALEVFKAGHYASESTPDLRPASLEGFAAQFLSRALLTEADPFRGLPGRERYGVPPALDLELADPAHASLSLGERHGVARELEAACMDLAGPGLLSVEATANDQDSEEWVLSSDGFEGRERGTEFWTGGLLSLRDEGGRRPESWVYAGVRRRRDLPAVQAVAEELVRRARAGLGAGKIASATLPVVVEGRCAGTLLGGFLAALGGRSLQQGQSFLAGRLGERVGSPAFTLVDDPFIPAGLGSRRYDGDGLPARRRGLVDGGVLRAHLVDWYYSRKLGVEPTTGSPSNLVLPAGGRGLEAALKDLGRCVLVTEIIGGNANPTTGDFSAGIAGSLCEGGRPVRALAEMNIAGNHLQLWQRLIEAAGEPYPWGTLRVPALVFDAVAVSGT